MNTNSLFHVLHKWQLLLRKIAQNDFTFEKDWSIQLLWDVATVKQQGKTNNYELSFRNQLAEFQLAVANAARYRQGLTLWHNPHLPPVPQLTSTASRVPFIIGDAAWMLALFDELVISDMLTISRLRCSLQSYREGANLAVHLPERDAYLRTLQNFFNLSGQYKDIGNLEKLFRDWRIETDPSDLSEFMNLQITKETDPTKSRRIAFLAHIASKESPVQLETKQVAQITDRANCTSPSFTQVELAEQITNELQKAQKRQASMLGSYDDKDTESSLYTSLTRHLRLIETASLRVRAEHARALDNLVSQLLLKLDFGNWFVRQLLPTVHRNHLMRVFSEEAKIDDDMPGFIRRSESMAYLEILESSARRLKEIVIQPLIPEMNAKEQEAANYLEIILQKLYTAFDDFRRLNPASSTVESTEKLLLARHETTLRLVKEERNKNCFSIYANGTTHTILWDFIQHLIVDTANLKVFGTNNNNATGLPLPSDSDSTSLLFPVLKTLDDMRENEEKKFGDVTFVEVGNKPNLASNVPRIQALPKNRPLDLSSVVLFNTQTLASSLFLKGVNYESSAWPKGPAAASSDDSWSRVKAHFDTKLIPWIKSLIPLKQYRDFIDVILNPRDGLLSAQHRDATHPRGKDLRAAVLEKQQSAPVSSTEPSTLDDSNLTMEERELIEEDPDSLLEALESTPELSI